MAKVNDLFDLQNPREIEELAKLTHLVRGLYPKAIKKQRRSLSFTKIKALKRLPRWQNLTKEDLYIIIDFLIKFIEKRSK